MKKILVGLLCLMVLCSNVFGVSFEKRNIRDLGISPFIEKEKRIEKSPTELGEQRVEAPRERMVPIRPPIALIRPVVAYRYADILSAREAYLEMARAQHFLSLYYNNSFYKNGDTIPAAAILPGSRELARHYHVQIRTMWQNSANAGRQLESLTFLDTIITSDRYDSYLNDVIRLYREYEEAMVATCDFFEALAGDADFTAAYPDGTLQDLWDYNNSLLESRGHPINEPATWRAWCEEISTYSAEEVEPCINRIIQLGGEDPRPFPPSPAH